MITTKRFLSLMLTWVFVSLPAYSYELPRAKDISGSRDLEYLQRISNGVSELSDRAAKAVVFISVSKIVNQRPYGAIDPFDFFFGPRMPYPQQRNRKQQSGLGSGFMVDLDKGYIITNNHVIEGADEISLKLSNGETYTGKVLGSDKNTDVAVVQIKDEDFDRKGLTQLTLGNSEDLKVGSLVLALGAPFGLETSISFGVVSATGRGNLNITSLGNFIQTDAAINPGNSGGPLIDMNGQVVGMNTAIYSRSGASAGIGFAVPSNLVAKIATQLITDGKVARGYLGVQLSQEIDDDLAQALELPKGQKGALIARVEPGTPAADAGLRDQDVIVKVNKTSIRSRDELTNTVGLMPAGTKVKVQYYRDGKLRSTTVTLGEFPSNPMASRRTPSKQSDDTFVGMNLEVLDLNRHRNWIDQYGIESRSGIIITDVSPDSKAAAAGLQPGDVLIKANRQPLKKPQDFLKIYKSSSKILIQLERRGAYRFASLRK
ncbi:Do family serine endopeptidase [Pseudobacteriovorax antillogorgiicola]|uniref:Serine protease Do n=1 Tax=Pseudobacteriovorax antillogorgiicola TaxID=1513793 RepID=A0A1Y6BAR4_9BACT|nr:Do family serine endopeptidase [Pseudobacteriovorax antillogorgiicola]TCS58875.1 serine protease Do [Pseudobacteriovorax antillogorgiicola]SME93778.1 serine protease Do [Pseudobacteriovorax antillogorgiicola]